jgi:Flp pilus assembly pilin Flp
MAMMTICRRLIFDDHGQDLIEYALLGGLIAVGTIVAWTNVQAAVGVTYNALDTHVQTLSATTPDPIAP